MSLKHTGYFISNDTFGMLFPDSRFNFNIFLLKYEYGNLDLDFLADQSKGSNIKKKNKVL